MTLETGVMRLSQVHRHYPLLVAAAVLLSSSVWAAGAVEDYQYPVFSAPAGSAPVIDGTIEEDEWADASSFGGFLHNYPLGEEWRDFPLLFAVPTPSTIWLKWDAERVYLAFSCRRLGTAPLVANTGVDERDVNILRQEAFELFLVPTAESHFFFAGNPNGAIFDGRNKPEDLDQWDRAWDGGWEFRTSVDAGAWQGELSVPFSSLGVAAPVEGESWGFSANRYQPGLSRSGLTPIGGMFFERALYGRLVFTRGVRVRAAFPRVRLRSVMKVTVTNVSDAVLELNCQGGLFGTLASAGTGIRFPDVMKSYAFESMTLCYDPGSGAGERISVRRALTPGTTETCLAMLPSRDGDRFLAVVELHANGTVYYSQAVPLLHREQAAIEVKIGKYLLSRRQIDVIVKGYTVSGRTVELQWLDASGKAIAARSFERTADEDVIWTVDARDLAPGEHAVIVSADGGSRTVPVVVPELPPWHTEHIGDARTIPPPFRPISVAGDALSFSFGQTLRFPRDGVLPRQVTSVYGQEVLAAPISLLAESPDGQLDLRSTHFEQDVTGDGEVHRRAVLLGQGVRIAAETRIEFDGLAWTTLSVSGTTPLSRLCLRIPLPADVATLYKALKPDIVLGSKVLRGRLPAEGVKLGFMPCVWVGDIDRGGLEWTCESDRDWSLHDPVQALSIEPESGHVVLTVCFIDKPTELTRPLTFAFGLLPTPVRDPRRTNFWKDTPMVYTASPSNRKYFEAFAQKGRTLAFWMAGEPPPRQFASGVVAVYPLEDNLSGVGGTLSFWMKLVPEISQPAMDACYLHLGQHRGVKLDLLCDGDSWRNDGMKLRLRWFGDKSEQAVSEELAWDATAFHHLAVSWRSGPAVTQFELWGDGRQLAQVSAAVGLDSLDLRAGRLFIGGNTQAVFDDISITRSAAEPTVVAAVPTAGTLLLDRLDVPFVPNDYLQTTADIISGSSAETGAWVDLWAEFVPGKAGMGLKLSTATVRTNTELAVALGARVFHSHYWHRSAFSCMWLPESETHEEFAKSWQREVNAEGARTSVYYLKNISPDDPYWEDFGDELVLRPLRPSINNYVLCPEGPGGDFLTWTVMDMIKRYGVDGVHMDYGAVMGCEGLHHGCGWCDSTGRTHKTWPILANRRMNRRIYSLFHLAPKTDGTYKNHTSSGAILAADGLADYFVTGELEQHTPKEGMPIGTWLPEDEYLAFYSYRVTGIPCYGGLINPWSYLAFDGVPVSQTHLVKLYPVLKDGRLHPYREGGDTDVRSSGRMFWPAFVEFADGELIGFWRTQSLVRLAHDDDYAERFIRVSLVQHAREPKLLVLVGNVGGEGRAVTPLIDYAAIGLGGGDLVARDVYTRDVLDAHKPTVRVNAENVRLLLVRKRFTGRLPLSSGP